MRIIVFYIALCLAIVSAVFVVSAIAGPKKGGRSSDPRGPDATTGGAPSKIWDGKYKVGGGGGNGSLVCPRRDDTPMLTVSGGKLKLALSAYNPAVTHVHSQGCDRDTIDADCEKLLAKIKASGASLDPIVKLAEIVVTIDKDGHMYGLVQPAPLPIPDDADEEQKGIVVKLAKIAVVSGEMHTDNVGRNAVGLGKGRVGSIELSTMVPRNNASCSIDLRATDYKAAGYCAASNDACKVDSDCCNHNCVPQTRSCR